MGRRFTLREAGNLLPQISRLTTEAVHLKSEYDRADASVQALAQKIMLLGGLLVDQTRAAESRHKRDRLQEKLKATLEVIQQTGCVVKDLEMGLVDFPTLFRGEEVYLCWKLGEPEIQFWHGVNEGFAGRKPIDQFFLDNHQGDPKQ